MALPYAQIDAQRFYVLQLRVKMFQREVNGMDAPGFLDYDNDHHELVYTYVRQSFLKRDARTFDVGYRYVK